MKRPPRLALTVQYPTRFEAHKALLPRITLRRWIKAALLRDAQFTLRFVGEREGARLNRTYRSKTKATNVLTFDYPNHQNSPLSKPHSGVMPPCRTNVLAAKTYLATGLRKKSSERVLSDIVLCCPVIEAEAQQQNKTLVAHYAHLIVHGVLHAQGYDHEEEALAQEMEAREIDILSKLGFANPYSSELV